MTKRIILTVICCMTILLEGCTSGRYSLDKISKYAITNKEELTYIADVAADVLSKDYYCIFMDEDEKLKVLSLSAKEHAKKTTDFILSADQISEISDEEIKELTNFFKKNYVDYISLIPYDSENSILRKDQKDIVEETTDSYIEMQITENTNVDYTISFIDINDISYFRNPMEVYDEGGFRKEVKKNRVIWTSDHRFDFFSGTAPVKYEAQLVNAAEGIWISREKIYVPFYLYFFASITNSI